MMSFDEMFGCGYSWARYGDGYEVTTKGDKRFSSFYAKLPNGKTIEEFYQVDVKGFASIADGKGKKPLNNLSRSQLRKIFISLWVLWAKHNPELIMELKEHADANNRLLTDMFATSDINQAHALSIILNNISGK